MTCIFCGDKISKGAKQCHLCVSFPKRAAAQLLNRVNSLADKLKKSAFDNQTSCQPHKEAIELILRELK